MPPDPPTDDWLHGYGLLSGAHPDSPSGGTGPGFCRMPGPLVGGYYDFWKPYASFSLVTVPAPGVVPPPPAVGSVTDDPPLKELPDETRYIAAVASGEGSTSDIFEELAGIAATLIRMRDAVGHDSTKSFVEANPNYTYAASRPTDRFKLLMKASLAQVNASTSMRRAVRAAMHALSGGNDHSNGAYYWDGEDIRTNYAAHPKVAQGIAFTSPAHNVLGIKAKDVPGEAFWDTEKKRSRGTWTHAWDSTAGHGRTIFWKLNADYLKATGGRQTSGWR
jgi:hypothetical protein